jgi:hypothetical protein
MSTFDIGLQAATELDPGLPKRRCHFGNDTETLSKREVNPVYAN